jgi:hypothetical protein
MLALGGVLSLAHLDRARAADLGRYLPPCVIDAKDRHRIGAPVSIARRYLGGMSKSGEKRPGAILALIPVGCASVGHSNRNPRRNEPPGVFRSTDLDQAIRAGSFAGCGT